MVWPLVLTLGAAVVAGGGGAVRSAGRVLCLLRCSCGACPRQATAAWPVYAGFGSYSTGTETDTTVPPFGLPLIEHWPPRMLMRSSMPTRPKEAILLRLLAPMPMPLSVMVMLSMPSCWRSSTRTRLARACCRMLLSDSCSTRNRAVAPWSSMTMSHWCSISSQTMPERWRNWAICHSTAALRPRSSTVGRKSLMMWRTLLMVLSIWPSVPRARVQARVALAGARGQHVGLDAQHQQVLAEVVVDFAGDALALLLLDLVGVRGQPAQLVVRQLQPGLAVAQFLGHGLGHLDGAQPRRRQRVEQHRNEHAGAETGQHRQPRQVGVEARVQHRPGRAEPRLPEAAVEIGGQHHAEAAVGPRVVRPRACGLAVEQRRAGAGGRPDVGGVAIVAQAEAHAAPGHAV